MITNLTVFGKTVSTAIAILGAFITSAIGGFDEFMKLLLFLVVFDYISGVAVAIQNKNLSSRIGFMGIFKKITIFLLIALAYRIDIAMHTSFVREVAVLFFVSNEGISFLENTSNLGVPYPPKLKEILSQLKKPATEEER